MVFSKMYLNHTGQVIFDLGLDFTCQPIADLLPDREKVLNLFRSGSATLFELYCFFPTSVETREGRAKGRRG